MSEQYPPNQPQQPMPPQGQYSQYSQHSSQPPPQGAYPSQPPLPISPYTGQPYDPSWYPPPQQQPSPPKKKKSRKGLWIAIAAFLVVAIVTCSLAFMAASGTSSSATATGAPTVDSSAPTTTPEPKPSPTPKPKPTAKPKPTPSQAQIEVAYKVTTTNTDVASLDKDGSAGQGNDVHFTSSIAGFVKDSSGNTAGANVTDPDASSGSVVQVLFTPGTDITQLNTGDTLEVWGTDQGASSGTNAFGATIQEVVVQAQYMKDQTTGYQADS